MEKRLLVTRGNGFLSRQIILDGLQQGYRIRTSILQYSEKEFLERLVVSELGAEFLKGLEFISAASGSAGFWDSAVQDVDAIFHLASLQHAPLEEIKHLFSAALKFEVHRLIVTLDNDPILSSKSYALPHLAAGQLRQVLVEKKVWEYARHFPQLQITSFCPTLCLGPLYDASLVPSIQLIQQLLRGKLFGIEPMQVSIIDHRDLSDLHYMALETHMSIGERITATAANLWMRDIAEILRAHFPKFSAKLPEYDAPSWLMSVIGVFDKQTKAVIPALNMPKDASPQKAIEVLGYHPRSVEEAVVATAESLLAFDLLD